MKPMMRALAVIATATAPLVSAPVFAHAVQSAPNGDYALSSQQLPKLAPHWHAYHNFRSGNAYHLRLALNREMRQPPTGSATGGPTQPWVQKTTTVSMNRHWVKTAPNGDYALSTQQPRQLAPHWYGYHNWRSGNAYQLRLALHRKVQRKANSAQNTASNASQTIG